MKTNLSEFSDKGHQAKKRTSTRCNSHRDETCLPQRTSDITNILIRVLKKKTEGQCQRIFKLLFNSAHFTCQQVYVQNPSSWASAVHEPRTFICTSQIQKRQRNQRSNSQPSLDPGEGKGVPPENIYFGFIDYAKEQDYFDPNKLENS